MDEVHEVNDLGSDIPLSESYSIVSDALVSYFCCIKHLSGLPACDRGLVPFCNRSSKASTNRSRWTTYAVQAQT